MASEFTIEPEKYGDGYALYQWGKYEQWSVLAGQSKKSYRTGYDTIEEAKVANPGVEAFEHRIDANNYTTHLPGEEWDDMRQEFRL